MSVVKINVLDVPEARREVLEQRFAARAGEVEHVDGFESFDLLRPTEGTQRYLVVTRWRDDEAFQAWMNSDAFRRGHTQPSDGQGGGGQPSGAAHGDENAGGQPSGAAHGDVSPGGHPHGAQGGPGGPAASGSELWSFDVVTSARGAGA